MLTNIFKCYFLICDKHLRCKFKYYGLLEKLNGLIIYLYTFNVKTTLLDKVSEEASLWSSLLFMMKVMV